MGQFWKSTCLARPASTNVTLGTGQNPVPLKANGARSALRNAPYANKINFAQHARIFIQSTPLPRPAFTAIWGNDAWLATTSWDIASSALLGTVRSRKSASSSTTTAAMGSSVCQKNAMMATAISEMGVIETALSKIDSSVD